MTRIMVSGLEEKRVSLFFRREEKKKQWRHKREDKIQKVKRVFTFCSEEDILDQLFL